MECFLLTFSLDSLCFSTYNLGNSNSNPNIISTIGYKITKAHLQLQKSDARSFSSVINESRRARVSDSVHTGVTVFLSHKHDEIEVLEEVISLLKNCGVSVYVDWMDEGMPKGTSWLTAIKLKKIVDCSKFVFLGTEGAIASKW